MADNVTLSTVTSGGVSAATDDVGGVHFQRIKIALGADGTHVGDVSSANPMPVVNSAAVTVTGSVTAAITGPVTVTGSVTSAITGPVTVTGTVAATQSGAFSVGGAVTAAITGPVTVTGSVTAVHAGPVTVTGSVTAVHAGPVTVTGAVSVVGQVSVLGSLSASINNLLGATVVAGSTVTGTVGVAKRVDTQATVGSAVNTATPLHVNEFGSLWVVSEPGDAQTTNGGGTTGIQVFMGAATTVGSVSLSGVLPGPVTVTGSVGISGPVTVTGSVTSVHAGPVTVTGSVAIAGPVTVAGSIAASSLFLEGTSISPGTTVVGGAAIGKRVDDASATVAATVGGGVALQTDAFGKLWVNAGTLSASVSGPMTVLGSVSVVGQVSVVGGVAISGPVTVTGSVTAAITGPVTVTGSVSTVGQVSIAGGVQGVTAHGTVAAGNPVLVGWQALAADQTAVTTTGVTRALATLLGKVVNHPYALPAQYTSYAAVTAGLATTVAATAFASAGASTRWYLTSAQFINQGAAVTRVILQDGAGAIYYTASLATSGGGVSATFPVPLRIAANQTVEIKLDTTGTTVYTNLQGYKAGE